MSTFVAPTAVVAGDAPPTPLVGVFIFSGLSPGWQLAFGVALAVVALMFVWSVALFWRSNPGHVAHRHVADDIEPLDADDFYWIFLVPALNEEMTINDSVGRLLAMPVRQRRIVVIDDGSDDRTPELLATLDHPDLTVLRRVLPDARRGKAAALNDAYRGLDVGDTERDRVIVVIVDADGRLHPDAPAHVATHFADPTVGGVQVLVRIYNRQGLLTWMQHLEFAVYDNLFQAGRNGWGTAGMGGNGQFNRLSALDDIADDEFAGTNDEALGRGPWRDRLTEDQDLGLRLFVGGWRSRQDLTASIDQQGLSSLRPLLRQRTRWSQGNLQAFGLARPLWRAPFPVVARLELLTYLLMPLLQGIVGLALVGAAFLAITGVAPLWAGGPTWQLVAVYVLAFGGTVLGCVAARRDRGIRGWAIGLALGHAYAFYTWLTWPVLARSAVRHFRQREEWMKTAREPIEVDASPV